MLREVVRITVRFGPTHIIIKLNASIVVKALKQARIEGFFFEIYAPVKNIKAKFTSNLVIYFNKLY